MPWELEDRFADYAVRILRMSAALPKAEEALHIRRQILRSGTSAGANYHEARGAESRPDFVHKLQIVLKELRETHFWLRIISSLKFTKNGQLSSILAETEELIAITVRSLKTARRGMDS